MGESVRQVIWRPQPGPQTALLECPIEDVLYGGARGGGKTDGLLGDWLSHAGKYGKNARGILFRRTLTPELEEVILRARELFSPLGATYQEQKHTWTFPNGATLRLRYLKDKGDELLYQGHSYTWQGWDEAGNWPDPSQVDTLQGTLRSPHGIPCVRRLTANPGGVGHHWLKARYITPAPPFTPHRYKPQPATHPDIEIEAVFIPSQLDDNRYLVGTEYERNIAAATSGNTALWQAWRYGNWDVVAGAAFDEWRADLHVLERFTPPPSWSVMGGMDGGTRSPSCVELAACGPDGDIVFCYEWHWKNKDFFTAGRDVGISMLQVQDMRIDNHVIIFADSQMFQDTGIGGLTQGYEFQRGLNDVMGSERAPVVISVDKGPGSRRMKTAMLRQLLHWETAEDGTVPPHLAPRVRFHRRCRNAIETIPALPVSPKDPEDVDTKADDHSFDAVTYLLLGNMPRPDRPKSDPYSQNVSPGFHPDGMKRKPHIPGWDAAYERQLADEMRRNRGEYVGSGMGYTFGNEGFEDV